MDGSVLADVPVCALREQGADFTIGVKLGPKSHPEYATGFDVLNIIEMMKEDTIVGWELECVDFRIDISIPQMDIFDFEHYQLAIEEGYQTTSNAVNQIRKRIDRK